MATQPIYYVTPVFGYARLTEAVTAADGTGNLSTCFTAAAATRIKQVTVMSAQLSAAASSAMVFRLFVTDANGANPRLRAEIAIVTATRSATAIGATNNIFFPTGLKLAAGQLLKCCISVYAGGQDQMDVVVEGDAA